MANRRALLTPEQKEIEEAQDGPAEDANILRIFRSQINRAGSAALSAPTIAYVKALFGKKGQTITDDDAAVYADKAMRRAIKAQKEKLNGTDNKS
jgi:hypothetical protein